MQTLHNLKIVTNFSIIDEFVNKNDFNNVCDDLLYVLNHFAMTFVLANKQHVSDLCHDGIAYNDRDMGAFISSISCLLADHGLRDGSAFEIAANGLFTLRSRNVML